jgi:hypothetical protein
MHHSQCFCHFFKCILEVVLSTTCDSVSITAVVSKWQPFSSVFNWGNRKVGWVGDNSHVVFGQKFPGEKGSVGRCVVMMQQPILLPSKSSNISRSHRKKITVVCRIDSLVCQDEFFVNNPLDVKENDEHALGFVIHLSRLHAFQTSVYDLFVQSLPGCPLHFF